MDGTPYVSKSSSAIRAREKDGLHSHSVIRIGWPTCQASLTSNHAQPNNSWFEEGNGTKF